MEDDHDLDLQIFRNNHNCNWEVSSSYKLQLPSAILSIPISPSPSPTPQVPSPGGREAVDAVVPLVPVGRLVLHQQIGPHSFILPHMVNMVSVVPHRRADRYCGSSTLEALGFRV